MRRARTVLTSLVLALALAVPCAPRASRADAPPAPTREYQMKAAFICNFLQFVDWPDKAFANANDPVVITVLGDNPFGPALDQLTRDKSVRGREVVVRYAKNAAAVGRTQVLFVAANEAARGGQVLADVGPGPILTVADTENFTAAGGAVRFFSEENKMRFEINAAAVQRAGLKVSAKLMQLAKPFKEN